MRLALKAGAGKESRIPTRIVALLVSKIMIVYGFTAIIILLLIGTFEKTFGAYLDPNIVYVLAAILTLFLLLLERRIRSFGQQLLVPYFTTVSAVELAKLYSYLAIISIFLSVSLFGFQSVLGESYPLLLTDVIVVAFFMQKFIDMNMVAMPRTLLVHLSIWIFLIISSLPYFVGFSLVIHSSLFQYDLRLHFVSFLLVYGLASHFIFIEKQDELKKTHPQYYLSLAHQALYTLFIVNGLMFSNGLLLFLDQPSLTSGLWSLLVMILVVINPLNYRYFHLVRWARHLRDTKDGRKFWQKMAKDTWQDDVMAISELAGAAGFLTFSIGFLGLYIGLIMLYSAAISQNIGYLLSGVFVLWIGAAPFLYGLRRSGMEYRFSRALKFLNLWRLPTIDDIRGSFERLIQIYAAFIPLLGGVLARLPGLKDKQLLLGADIFEITWV